MTKRELIKHLAAFDDEMEVMVCSPRSSYPRMIRTVEGYRAETDDNARRYLQDKEAQAAPDNVAVLFTTWLNF